MRLLTRETPDFIALTPWPANSPDLNPVDYWIREIAGACVLQLYSRRGPAEVAFDRRVGIFQPDDQLMNGEAVRQ